jgi:serine kinase of HPr protein (carbohydrate metabolism regulator)
MMPILHASLIARYAERQWQGVLILGPSGAGKSHLALKAISAGWRLVADDQVIVWSDHGHVFGRAPKTLAGLIEVRGLGIVKAPSPVLAFSKIVMVAHLASADTIERCPEASQETLAGLSSPALRLDPFSEVSLSILSLALDHLPVDE